MNEQVRTYPAFLRYGVLLLAVLLLFGLSPLAQTARADTGNGWEENIELTGEFSGTFTFTSNTSQIFRVDNAAPGDSWDGQITIRNSAGDYMEVALLTIVSELEDLELYNALTLDIQVSGETVYSGGYGDTPSQITPYYVVPAGSSLVMDVSVGFPSRYGNEMMGKEMNSTWTFEARLWSAGPGPAMYPYTVQYLDQETGEALAEEKHGYAPYGETVTEQALEIEGYTPDAAEKSIVIVDEGNLITFYYVKGDAPVQPSDPGTEPSDPGTEPTDPGTKPSEGPGGVQTGNDLGVSNTTTAIFIILCIPCALAALVTCLRVRAEKRRRKDD